MTALTASEVGDQLDLATGMPTFSRLPEGRAYDRSIDEARAWCTERGIDWQALDEARWGDSDEAWEATRERLIAAALGPDQTTYSLFDEPHRFPLTPKDAA